MIGHQILACQPYPLAFGHYCRHVHHSVQHRLGEGAEGSRLCTRRRALPVFMVVLVARSESSSRSYMDHLRVSPRGVGAHRRQSCRTVDLWRSGGIADRLAQVCSRSSLFSDPWGLRFGGCSSTGHRPYRWWFSAPVHHAGHLVCHVSRSQMANPPCGDSWYRDRSCCCTVVLPDGSNNSICTVATSCRDVAHHSADVRMVLVSHCCRRTASVWGTLTERI